jgi:uncharacterized protein (UPF0276 family)
VDNPSSVEQDFERRVAAIPALGLGLSVDVYQPDLFDLMSRLDERGLRPGYLEIFKATTTALETVRRRFPDIPLVYHGEGLWITQPDFRSTSFLYEDLAETICQLDMLDSFWLNHECATKQMAGYSFGTYLPPLYTPASARVVADNIALVQGVMDWSSRQGRGAGPLFLLELPPLTYFAAGTVPIPKFFRLITEQVSCGLVLDVGHLWTIYRYTDVRRQLSLDQFVESFLNGFPLERVVEIHIAGLGCHESQTSRFQKDLLPEWIDLHAAPIPAVSFAMLQQVLAHPRLVNLRGLALEVDTKPITRIVDEFHAANERFGNMINVTIVSSRTVHWPVESHRSGMSQQDASTPADRVSLQVAYADYAQVVSGQKEPTGPEWQGVRDDPAGLTRYAGEYLPYEILHWGGELTDMFPETCRALAREGIALDEFLRWWFRKPRPVDRSYDFFLLKIDLFLEFVAKRGPAFKARAEREADVLRQAYTEANEGAGQAMESLS